MPEAAPVPGRRRVVAGFGAGVLAAALGAPALLVGCTARSPLRVVTRPGPGLEFERLARDRGLVDTDLYTLDTPPEDAEGLDALLRGDAQAAVTSLEQVLRARAAGLSMEVVLLVAISHGADGLVAREPLRSVAELAGKRVAMEDSATAAVLLEKSLEGSGVPVSAIERVPLGDDPEASWRDEGIAAMLTREPYLTRFESRGARRLADTSRMPLMIMDVLAVRADVGRDHMPGVHELARALLKGRAVLGSNPVDSGYRLAERLGIDQAEVQGLYRRLLLPDLDYNRHLLAEETELEGNCEPLARAVGAALGGSVEVSCKALFSPRALPESLT